MKTEIITNRGKYNLEGFLIDDLKSCKTFDIASAFVTEHALNVLNSFIKRNRNSGRTGRMLISLYARFNSSAVLKGLSTLSIANKNIDVKISINPRFHWKYYHFSFGRSQTVYIGSSNFTKEGLSSSGEVVTRIKFSNRETLKQLIYKDAFDKEWEDSFAINKLPLNKYKQAVSSPSKNKLHPDILKLLQKKVVQKTPSEVQLRFATTINGFLKSTTVKLINQNESHWDRYSWDYFSCNTKSEYDALRSKDTFLIIETINRKYSFVIAERLDECSGISTPDGRYFIAYKRLRKRKETAFLRNEFESLGINYHSRTFVSKAIGSRQEKKFLELLGYQN
jgi:HKD family nuclease